MDKEINSQIYRAKELYTELRESCERDLKAEAVSDKTRNLTQEVLVKMSSVFDQAMRLFYRRMIEPGLTEEEKKNVDVYFPVSKKPEGIISRLGRQKMASLEKTHPTVFAFLKSVQSFAAGYEWMKAFKDYANARHIELTPQKKIVVDERIKVSRENGEEVSWSTNWTKFGAGGNVAILQAPIDPDTQTIVPTSGVTSKREIWIAFKFADSGIDALQLCEKAVNEGERIITEFLKLF